MAWLNVLSASYRAWPNPNPSTQRERGASLLAQKSSLGLSAAQEVLSFGSGVVSSSGWVVNFSAAVAYLIRAPSLPIFQSDNCGQIAWTMRIFPSISARVPAQSWVLPHVVVAWFPVWAMLQAKVSRIQLSPAPVIALPVSYPPRGLVPRSSRGRARSQVVRC